MPEPEPNTTAEGEFGVGGDTVRTDTNADCTEKRVNKNSLLTYLPNNISVSSRPVAAEDGVRSQYSPCGICG